MAPWDWIVLWNSPLSHLYIKSGKNPIFKKYIRLFTVTDARAEKKNDDGGISEWLWMNLHSVLVSVTYDCTMKLKCSCTLDSALVLLCLFSPSPSFPFSSPIQLEEVMRVLSADYQTWKGFPKFKTSHRSPTLLLLLLTLCLSPHPHCQSCHLFPASPLSLPFPLSTNTLTGLCHAC